MAARIMDIAKTFGLDILKKLLQPHGYAPCSGAGDAHNILGL
ncbi:hypothetical protein [Peptoclostridium acidaminophilum]|nr:hypothetical protein [Peptoclostridium acidaminophilum]